MNDQADELARLEARIAELELRVSNLNAAQRVARVGSWVWDVAAGEVELSAELRRIMGLEDDEPLTFDAALQWIHPEERAELAQLSKAVAGGKPVPHTELRIVRGDGEVLRVVVDADTTERNGNRVFIGTVMDVTRRRVLEAQLRQAQKMEGVGLLAGGLAHDFNNTLSVILGNATMLSERLDAEELDAIIQAASSAGSLTRRLLSFGSSSPLDIKLQDLGGIVERFKGVLERLVGDTITLKVVPSPQPLHVEVDAGLMEQVLLNLAANARDAMPLGGTLTISVVKGTEPKTAELRVTDTGAGIDPAIADQIFEPFFTTKHNGVGTGLGLSLVAEAVERSGGGVHLESEPGKGTTVGVVLPSVDSVQAASKRAKVLVETQGPTRVLLLEDEVAVRRMLRRILSRADYEVQDYGLPKDALAEVTALPDAALPYDLIVSDVTMPGMSGPEFVKRVRERWPEFKCLFVSGYVGADESIETSKITRFLAKPFEPAALLAEVEALLREPG